jgi:hypothetical protein
MNDPRVNATATRLRDDRVLITGGYEAISPFGETILATAELYDPTTGKFTRTGSMTTPRAEHTATLLSDGQVLITGGNSCRNMDNCGGSAKNGVTVQPLASAELYDPATGRFTRTGSMADSRVDAVGTLLPDGRVLVAGGGGNPATELYNPKSGKFERTGKGLAGLDIASATLLPSRRVLLLGNVTCDTHCSPRAELYDPATEKIAAAPFAPKPGAAATSQYTGQAFEVTAGDTANLLPDGQVLLSEGPDFSGPAYLELYDPSTGGYDMAGFMPPLGWGWNNPTATRLADGRVLYEGGWFMTTVPWAAIYNPATGIHSIVSMTTSRDKQTATLLSDGSVLIAGGTTDEENVLSSAELFRP